MSKLSRDDVLKLARLAQLELNEDEVEQFRTELSEILSYVEQLQKVDVTGLSPTTQVTGLKNVTRDDDIQDYGVTSEELLKNLPERKGSYIKVKRVLE